MACFRLVKSISYLVTINIYLLENIFQEKNKEIGIQWRSNLGNNIKLCYNKNIFRGCGVYDEIELENGNWLEFNKS